MKSLSHVRSLMVCTLICGSCSGFAFATELYSNDFESVGDPLVEWSSAQVVTSPNGSERFIGAFQSESTTLTLSGLPQHDAISISFDLYIIGSWDGQVAGSGPDIWELSCDGNSLMRTTFSNTANRQNYPAPYPGSSHPAATGAAVTNTLGYSGSPGFYLDSTYRFPDEYKSFDIAHSGDTLELTFLSNQTENHIDEMWGIDNLVITPEPSSLAIMVLGFALTYARRRL